jgi:hypothetical protein
LCDRFELEKQTRLSNSWIAHRRYDLTVPLSREFERVLHLLQLGLSPDELRQSALRRHLQARAQRPESNHLEDVHLPGHTLNAGRAQIPEHEVAFAEFSDLLSRRYRASWRQRLHSRRQARRMANRRLFRMTLAGRNRTDHNFSSVHSYPGLDRQIAGPAQLG